MLLNAFHRIKSELMLLSKCKNAASALPAPETKACTNT